MERESSFMYHRQDMSSTIPRVMPGRLSGAAQPRRLFNPRTPFPLPPSFMQPNSQCLGGVNSCYFTQNDSALPPVMLNNNNIHPQLRILGNLLNGQTFIDCCQRARKLCCLSWCKGVEDECSESLSEINRERRTDRQTQM